MPIEFMATMVDLTATMTVLMMMMIMIVLIMMTMIEQREMIAEP